MIQGTPSIALQFADGTASSPSIKFTSALTTGLYRSAANELSIATTGGQAIKVESNNKTTIYGDLVVTGGTNTISSTQIDVNDKNLQLATGNSSDAANYCLNYTCTYHVWTNFYGSNVPSTRGTNEKSNFVSQKISWISA